MGEELEQIHLAFGRGKVFHGQLLSRQLITCNRVRSAGTPLPETVLRALRGPQDVPALRQTAVTGDRVTLVLERDTPAAPEIVGLIWQELEAAGVTPENLLILEPASLQPAPLVDPRTALPPAVAAAVNWQRHDPTDPAACTYLASSASGVRFYLSRQVVDADLVIPVGPIIPDPLLGYRGGTSGLYPGLGDVEALRKCVGQSHQELGPGDARPLRQLADEVGWLLGVQFCVGVVPAGDAGSACLVAGNPEYVLQAGKQAYEEEWQLQKPERAELVVMAVSADAAGHGWEQVSRALETARQLVERKGRIVLLTELAEAPSPGIQMLSQFRSPKAALKPLRAAMPPDVVTATRIALAADWAEVFLYSQLPDQTVEDLFLHPLGSLTELQRLLDAGISTSVISGGQYALVDPD